VTVAGVGVTSYNGTFPIVSVPSSTQFTYIAGASGLPHPAVVPAAACATNSNRRSARLVVGNSSHNERWRRRIQRHLRRHHVPRLHALHFTAATGGLAASGGGTASAAGSIGTGVRQVCVLFKTRQAI